MLCLFEVHLVCGKWVKYHIWFELKNLFFEIQWYPVLVCSLKHELFLFLSSDGLLIDSHVRKIIVWRLSFNSFSLGFKCMIWCVKIVLKLNIVFCMPMPTLFLHLKLWKMLKPLPYSCLKVLQNSSLLLIWFTDLSCSNAQVYSVDT